MGFVGQRNIVFNVGSPVALRSLAAARCGDTVKHIGFTLVFKSLSIGSRIVQFTVSKFRTNRQYIIDTKFERNIRFAAETQVFQTALNKIQACVAAFRTAGQTFGQVAVDRALITDHVFGIAPFPCAVMR